MKPPMESKISPSSVLIRKPNLIYNEIDGEVVILSIDNSEYYSLNSIGSEIWRLLDKPKTFDEIIDTLLKRSLCHQFIMN